MMVIEYTSQDKSLNIRLEYITSNSLRIIEPYGKSYPKTTQCLLYKNGLLCGFGTVIKHDHEPDNPKFAMRLATKKVISVLRYKDLRKELWELVINATK